jgi:hypothetical protein
MHFIEVINKNSKVIADVMDCVNPTQLNIDNNRTCKNQHDDSSPCNFE